MPKANCIKSKSHLWCHCLLSIGAYVVASGVYAQTPALSLNDVVQNAKNTKAQEYGQMLNQTLRLSPGSSQLQNPQAPKGSELPLAPPVPLKPSLRAIYGVNDLIEAEVVFDGQAYAINSMEPRVEIGPWRFGVVTSQGVYLFQKPLTAQQVNLMSSWMDRATVSMSNCRAFDEKKNQCLYLPVIKASADTLSTVRTSTTSMSIPPLPVAPERMSR